jgi:hypothetical protein
MRLFFATNRFADANWTGGQQPLSYKISEQLPVVEKLDRNYRARVSAGV